MQRPMIRPKAGSANGLTRSQSLSGAGIGLGVGIESSISKAFCRAGIPFAPLASSGEATFFRTTVVLLVEAGAAPSAPVKTGNRSLFLLRLTSMMALPDDRPVPSACERWNENCPAVPETGGLSKKLVTTNVATIPLIQPAGYGIADIGSLLATRGSQSGRWPFEGNATCRRKFPSKRIF
jgi:hypothetical protein